MREQSDSAEGRGKSYVWQSERIEKRWSGQREWQTERDKRTEQDNGGARCYDTRTDVTLSQCGGAATSGSECRAATRGEVSIQNEAKEADFLPFNRCEKVAVSAWCKPFVFLLHRIPRKDPNSSILCSFKTHICSQITMSLQFIEDVLCTVFCSNTFSQEHNVWIHPRLEIVPNVLLFEQRLLTSTGWSCFKKR